MRVRGGNEEEEEEKEGEGEQRASLTYCWMYLGRQERRYWP